MELFFFSRTGQRGHRRRAALDHGGHVIEVAGAHFLLVSHEGVALGSIGAHLRMSYIAMVFVPDCRQGLLSPEVVGSTFWMKLRRNHTPGLSKISGGRYDRAMSRANRNKMRPAATFRAF